MKIIFLTMLIFSCNNNNIEHYKVLKPKLSKSVLNQNNTLNDELIWDAPTNWKQKNTTSSIRLEEFDIAYTDGMGDLSVVKLSSDGGGLEANINRWRGQLNLDPISLEQINASSFIGIASVGNFQWFEIIDKNNINAILAAIIPFKNFTYFVKLNATKKGTDEIKADFINFCSSFKAIEKNN